MNNKINVARVALWAMVRLLLRWRYGVRGALKPPLGCWYMHRQWTLSGRISNAWYRWRHICWRCDSWLYERSGLPEEWMGSYENMGLVA
jgi:hypothetical protein